MQQLLEKYPYAMDAAKEWFTSQMLESMEGDTNVPEEFKEMMRQQGVPVNNLAELIWLNPRVLFDMFDENSLFIQVTGDDENGWDWNLKTNSVDYDREALNPVLKAVSFSRKECEKKAVEHALSVLNDKLNIVISETPASN